jgi:hypothetical protein
VEVIEHFQRGLAQQQLAHDIARPEVARDHQARLLAVAAEMHVRT